MALSMLSGKKGILIPAALGLLAVLLTYQYIRQREQALGFLAEPLPVLVATKDIPRMTKLDETLLEVQKIPRKYVQPGSLSTVRDAVNQVSAAPIIKGEQILGTKLLVFGVDTGLAIKVPAGLRGVTVATTDVSGVAGLVRPGNYVDVLGTFDFGDRQKSEEKTFTLLQNVLVLAVEQNLGPESEAAKAKTMAEQSAGPSGIINLPNIPMTPGSRGKANVTLALPPKQAQDLVLAQEAGKISLTLRSIFEGHQTQNLPSTTLGDLLGVKEKVMFRPRPAWRELRGTSVGGRE